MTTKEKIPNDLTYKSVISKVEDVSDGTVVFWFAVHGNKDMYGHIGNKGMFQKSINENGSRIMHYKNHDPKIMPGVLIELKDEAYGGKAVSKLILSTKDGSETYEQYKAMAEAGKSMAHSYHFDFVKPTEDEAFKAFLLGKELNLTEVRLHEVSTSTRRPVNPLATTIDIKSFEDIDFADLLTEERYYKALLNCRFEDTELEKLQAIHLHIKSLIESRETTSRKPIDWGRIATGIINKSIN